MIDVNLWLALVHARIVDWPLLPLDKGRQLLR